MQPCAIVSYSGDLRLLRMPEARQHMIHTKLTYTKSDYWEMVQREKTTYRQYAAEFALKDPFKVYNGVVDYWEPE